MERDGRPEPRSAERVTAEELAEDRVKASGCSIIGKCAASGITVSMLPGMPSASARDWAGGVMASSAPTTTSVGTAIEASSDRLSLALRDRIAVRAT